MLLGCPAEEGGGGKIDLLNQGAFADLDFALMAHPSQFNLPKPVYVGMAKSVSHYLLDFLLAFVFVFSLKLNRQFVFIAVLTR